MRTQDKTVGASAGNQVAVWYTACPTCDRPLKLSHPDPTTAIRCYRCGRVTSVVAKGSLERTLALALAALVLYFPSNLLPIMHITSLGRDSADTVMSGVLALVDVGMYPIAFVLFLFSIVIPLFKILALILLVLRVRLAKRRRERTKLFHIIEFIGKWSVLDIYVLTLLVALLHFGQVIEAVPGWGALAFAGVVVLTIIASEGFDPRLIWLMPDETETRTAKRQGS